MHTTPASARSTVDEPLRVLVAEDDPTSRKVAQLVLRGLGHHVHAVGDGLAAVDAVRGASYDVVLMDVQMPVLDGWAATRRIRAELRAGRQPAIVAVTASSLVEHRSACAAAGMDACITKPLRPQTLRTVLASVRGRMEGRSLLAARDPSPPDEPRDREAFVRARLAELSVPGDDALPASLIRSFVARSPHLLDQLHQAANTGSSEQVERIAHALRGAADNIGCRDLAREFGHVEATARAGDLPTEDVLQQVSQEQSRTAAVLTGIAEQMEPA